MSKRMLSDFEIKVLNMDDEGRKYLKYNDKVGGKPLGLTIGMPDFKIEERFGGVIGLYDECIKRGITWEELLNTNGKFDELT